MVRRPGAREPSGTSSAARTGPGTPHAIRALLQRRAADSTPARDRRRSGRQQRETPRDVLRNLSRGMHSAYTNAVLAAKDFCYSSCCV